MDLIEQLGSLAFGTRLKRLSDRLYRDVSRLYEQEGIAFEARWFPVLYALLVRGRLSVTELAAELGLTHAAINQIAGDMHRRGLVGSSRDRTDERRRMLRLSARGKRTARRLKPLWDAVKAEMDELVATPTASALDALGGIEKELDRRDMYRRVRSRLYGEESDGIEIVDYRPAYKKWFRRLNEEWLREYFEVEPPDTAMLADPNGQILKRGGYILFACDDDSVLGTVALVAGENNSFELCKMAVAPKAQGQGIGRRLLTAAIDRAKQCGADRLTLETSPKLKAACRLYEATGFRRLKGATSAAYKRRTFAMSMDL